MGTVQKLSFYSDRGDRVHVWVRSFQINSGLGNFGWNTNNLKTILTILKYLTLIPFQQRYFYYNP